MSFLDAGINGHQPFFDHLRWVAFVVRVVVAHVRDVHDERGYQLERCALLFSLLITLVQAYLVVHALDRVVAQELVEIVKALTIDAVLEVEVCRNAIALIYD